MPRPLAVVTGASSGIGRELARTFARHGHDLIICAEDDELAAVAAELTASGTDVRGVRADLRTPEGVETLHDGITSGGRPVDALALNAGIGRGGAFVDQDVDDVLSVARLNVVGSVHLARLVLADMVARDSGRVLVSSSIASLSPGSYQAVYNASKSFLQSFAQAVQTELRGTAVTVTAMMPGPTATDFFRRAGMASDTVIGRGPKDSAEQVAAQGFAALMKGRRRVVTGSVVTRLQYAAGVVLPDRAMSAVHAVLAKPRPKASAGSGATE